MKAAILALALLAAGIGIAEAQRTPIPPVQSERFGSGYRIGPYPVPFEAEGVRTILWTWLIFNHVVEGRGNPSYKLYVTLKVQLDNLSDFARVVVEKKFNQNNCGRINAIDNWVYSAEPLVLSVRDAHNFRIQANGHISTWSCIENPIPETVCETYKDSFGLEFPYNCKFRASTPIKFINLQVGVVATEDLFLSTTTGGELQYLVKDPDLRLDDSGFFNPAINLIIDFCKSFGKKLVAEVQPSRVPIPASQDFMRFNPRYEDARFETTNGATFVSITASATLTSAQINEFMKNAIGPLWTSLAPLPQIAPPPPMTKTKMRADCQQSMPNVPVIQCAAMAGIPYETLPD